MSRASEAGNGVAKAIVDYAALYRVPCFRMQSRTINVVGAGGKMRPMFTGEWTDGLGQVHRKGMADFLLMPRIVLATLQVTVPLWVESKAGSGRLSPDQILFRDYILSTGAHYLLIENNPEMLVAWFKEHHLWIQP